MQRKWRRAWQRQVKRVSKQKVVQIFLPPLMAAGILLGSMAGVSANPAEGQVTVGSGSITQNGKVMTVTQNTNKLGINWQSFNIQAGEKVNFVQPNSQSVALNRVIGNEGSKIYGQLNANGQVYLVNPNGVLFAPGAQVNVGGIVASTKNLTDSNFQAGNYQFSGNGGTVVNRGTITATNGGYVALLGNQVSNEGIIVAKQGTVALGAGSGTTLDFNGDGLLNLTVSQPAIQALVENKNLIQADGGQVMMTARAADALAGTVINNTGMIQARSIETKNGVITLDGGPTGTVSVSGTLDATGNESGQTGGTVKVLGSNITVQSAMLNASGDQAGGKILIGGNAQGQGPEQNAKTTNIEAEVQIKADALTQGQGGQVVVWSDGTTKFQGTISASGGSVSGDGGQVEVSGKEKLIYQGFTDLRAAQGKIGHLLLDPANYTIAASGGDITGTALGNQLNSANVTIYSDNGTVNTNGNGDIEVNDAITWSGKTELDLIAYRDVNVNQNITGTGGGSLFLVADSTGSGTGTVRLNAQVSLTGSGNNTVGITYNPVGYSDAVTSSNRGGTNPYSGKVTGNLTAYMLVNSLNDLDNMRTNLNGIYMLGKDIDASTTAQWDSGKGFSPIGSSIINPFLGTFDGKNHTISGLPINRPDDICIGLFGYSTDSVIQNVGLTGTNIRGDTYVGGLVGYNNGGTITNSYSTGTVTGGSSVGGLVGQNSRGTITNSYSTGNVTVSDSAQFYHIESFVGGLVGISDSGTIKNSYSTAAVTGNNSVKCNIGGLVGLNGGTIESSYSKGTLTGSNSADSIVGGLVGINYNIITNSYSTSTVQGNNYVGGLVGENGDIGFKRGNITNSYSTGNVTGSSYVGGLVGMDSGTTTITNSYSTSEVTGSSTVGGLVGQNSGTIESSYSTGKVTGSSDNVGGLVGFNYNMIKNSYSASEVKGNDYVGGLVGENQNLITDSHSIGTVTGSGDNIGGLVGENDGGIDKSYSTGKVKGSSKVGGLVGLNYLGTIQFSYSTGTVIGSGDNIGGLVGHNDNRTIQYSYSTGAVTGNSNVGGLAGWNTGNIVYSYSTGMVTGSGDKVGGLVGYNGSNCAIEYSYSAGAVTGSSYVGGLVGFNEPANPANLVTISNCYWDVYTSGQTVGIGNGGSSPGPLTSQGTKSAYAKGSYSGWDISDTGGSTSVWRIYEGYTYPLLSSFLTPLTVSADSAEKTYDGAIYNGSLNGATYSSGGVSTSTAPGNVFGTLSYGNGTNAGTYNLSGLYSNQLGYDVIYSNNSNLTINRRNITVKANDQSRIYGDANPSSGTVSLTSGTSMVNGDTLGNANLSSNATAISDVGSSYTLTPSGVSFTSGSASNYNITYTNGILTITPRNITVTANDQSRIYGDANPSSGTVSLSTGNLVNGDILGNASLNSNATAASGVGSYALTPSGVSFTSGSASNYYITYADGILAITPRNITVTANASKAYGDTNPVSGAVNLTSGSMVNRDTLGNASLSSNAATTSIVGSYTLTPSGVSFASGSTSNYHITYTNGTLTINPRNITVTANSQSRIYGDANPSSGAVTVTTGSMVNGDTVGNASLSSNATTASGVGGYDLAPSGVSFTSGSASNYNINYANGTLTITPRTITITVNDQSRSYGDANPSSGTVRLTAGNLVNGDTLGNASLITNATVTSPVGSYALIPIGVSFTRGSAANYNITSNINYSNGTLTITPRNITVTADASKVYGDANPLSGSVSLTGGSLVNGDTLGDASLNSNATATSGVGSYALTPSGVSFMSGSASNYHITYTNGTLTIAPRNIAVTANDQSRIYGDANPFSGTVILTSGSLVNGDTLGNASLSSNATTTSPVGSYALTPGGVNFTSGSAANYYITYGNGTLAITPRNITITASDTTKWIGTPNPSFTAIYSGLAGGNTPLSLEGTLRFTTLASTASPVGSYLIIPSGLSSANYNITFHNGILTVTQAPDSYNGAQTTANHTGSNGPLLLGMTNSFRSNSAGDANLLLVISDGGINLGDDPSDNRFGVSKL